MSAGKKKDTQAKTRQADESMEESRRLLPGRGAEAEVEAAKKAAVEVKSTRRRNH